MDNGDGGGGSDDKPVPDDPFGCDNPMCQVFRTKPYFQRYTYQDTDKNYEEQFWDDEIFGGPVTEPLMRPDAEGKYTIQINNTMVEGLQKEWDEKKDLSGYFELFNVQYGKTGFYDYWIYINNLDQAGYDLLVSMNSTTDKTNQKTFRNIGKYLTGYVRDIYF